MLWRHEEQNSGQIPSETSQHSPKEVQGQGRRLSTNPRRGEECARENSQWGERPRREGVCTREQPVKCKAEEGGECVWEEISTHGEDALQCP